MIIDAGRLLLFYKIELYWIIKFIVYTKQILININN